MKKDSIFNVDASPDAAGATAGLPSSAQGRSIRQSNHAKLLSGCVLLSLLLSGCAAYQIGNHTLYPAEIQTVYVPVFKSNSFRRNLGERLTEAVVKEIETKTPYKVVSDPKADSVLSGQIVSETKRVLVPSLTGDAREVQAAITIEVSWIDRKGRMLRQIDEVPVPEEIAEITGTGNVVPEVGQSIATAQQQAICRLAEQIVSMMEKPW